MPSRKWFRARIVAVTGLAVLIATSGWHLEATLATITLLSEAGIAYATPNRKRRRRKPPPVAQMEGGPRR